MTTITIKNSPSTVSQTIGSTRTQIYPNSGAVGAGVTAILFEGVIANVDNSNMLEHTVIIEVLRADATTYDVVINKGPVPYNSAFGLPKIVLMTGEKLYATSSTNNMLVAKLSIAEVS